MLNDGEEMIVNDSKMTSGKDQVESMQAANQQLWDLKTMDKEIQAHVSAMKPELEGKKKGG